MNARRILNASLLGTLLILTALAAPAAAHKTVYSPDNKIRFTYGHLDEPIFTFQKTGLDLTLRDNATSATLPGYEMPTGTNAVPKLYVIYRYGDVGGEELNITTKFAAQFGSPGKYTYPIMFTQPGFYTLLIRGVINGTYYDMVIPPPHEVPDGEELMWPKKVDDDATQAAKIAALEQEVAALKAQNGGARESAPGLDVVPLLITLMALVVLWTRRR